ncbi:MAG: hypothetical protein QG604_747 [Candidatus Dependentiae bacterium]|nr:hypothetical protein [Candidatus Dependentiae bacterium]
MFLNNSMWYVFCISLCGISFNVSSVDLGEVGSNSSLYTLALGRNEQLLVKRESHGCLNVRINRSADGCVEALFSTVALTEKYKKILEARSVQMIKHSFDGIDSDSESASEEESDSESDCVLSIDTISVQEKYAEPLKIGEKYFIYYPSRYRKLFQDGRVLQELGEMPDSDQERIFFAVCSLISYFVFGGAIYIPYYFTGFFAPWLICHTKYLTTVCEDLFYHSESFIRHIKMLIFLQIRETNFLVATLDPAFNGLGREDLMSQLAEQYEKHISSFSCRSVLGEGVQHDMPKSLDDIMALYGLVKGDLSIEDSALFLLLEPIAGQLAAGMSRQQLVDALFAIVEKNLLDSPACAEAVLALALAIHSIDEGAVVEGAENEPLV